MKKLLICIMLLTFSLTGMAQDISPDKPVFFPKLFWLNKSCSVGMLGATMDNFNYGAIGVNASFYGFYVDFMMWPRKHDNSVLLDKWEDHRQIGYHFGYQIPFHQYQDGSIRLIPMIGHVKIEKGITDGSDWYVGTDGVVNRFTINETIGGFDYGAALAFSNRQKGIGGYTMYLAYTRYTAWIGFAAEFNLHGLKK